MIQRIQSVYLFIVFLLMAAMFFLPVPESINAVIWPFFCGIMGVAAFVTIFFYKKRKIQMICCRSMGALLLGVSLASSISAISRFGMTVSSLILFIPLLAAGFAFAAYFAIKKDEKLVRSLDRLR